MLVFVFAVLLTAPAEARRRAAHIPERLPDVSTPAGWLLANAHVLHSTTLTVATDDLHPLRSIVGDASVVGLGDGTHGTHEFTTIKLRLIDFLAREKGFDVVAFEAPFPLMNRINAYVQGGPGDPRAILEDGAKRLQFWFWYTEEVVEVFEWMRARNAQRGNAPPLEVVGVDVRDDATAVAEILAYLRAVDPAYAVTAEGELACVPRLDQVCRASTDGVRQAIAEREAAYVAASSSRAYHDALRNASILLRDDRDTMMAEGVLWARRHRGTSGKILFWAHNEHVARDNSSTDAGRLLFHEIRAEYVTIATMSGPGTFAGWRNNSPLVAPLPEITPGSYESYFRQRGAAAVLIPTRGEVPTWLRGPSTYRAGSTDGSSVRQPSTLPLNFDAVVYIEQTTPVAALR